MAILKIDQPADFLPIDNRQKITAAPIPGLAKYQRCYVVGLELPAGLSPIIDKVFQAVFVDISGLVVMVAHGNQGNRRADIPWEE